MSDSRKEKRKEGKMCPRERQGSVLKFGGEGEAQIECKINSGELAQGAGMPCTVQTNDSRRCCKQVPIVQST